MVRLPVFTARLSNGYLGAERPQQVKPHTAKEVKDPRRTSQSDGILQLLLGQGTTAAAQQKPDINIHIPKAER